MNTASFIESIAPCVFRAAQLFYAIGHGYRYNAIARSVEPDPGSLISPLSALTGGSAAPSGERPKRNCGEGSAAPGKQSGNGGQGHCVRNRLGRLP